MKPLAVFWTAATAAAVALALRHHVWEEWRVLTAFGICFAVYAALARDKRIRYVAEALSSWQRGAVFVLLVCLLGVQYAARVPTSDYYPFAYWYMFSRNTAAQKFHYHEYEAKLADGSTEWIAPAQYFITLDNWRYRHLVNNCLHDRNLIVKILEVFRKKYNESHPENPCEELSLVTTSGDLDADDFGLIRRTWAIAK